MLGSFIKNIRVPLVLENVLTGSNTCSFTIRRTRMIKNDVSSLAKDEMALALTGHCKAGTKIAPSIQRPHSKCLRQ